jgi:hypothetical protein
LSTPTRFKNARNRNLSITSGNAQDDVYYETTHCNGVRPVHRKKYYRPLMVLLFLISTASEDPDADAVLPEIRGFTG